jgi:hypothetical protein
MCTGLPLWEHAGFLRIRNVFLRLGVVLLICLLLGVCALILDSGFESSRAFRLQNALEIAAQAAVKELPADSLESAEWANAKNAVIKMLQSSGEDTQFARVEPLYEHQGNTGRVLGVKVESSIRADFYFANGLGIKENLTRAAQARLLTADVMSGLAPFFITKATLQGRRVGEMKLLKFKSASGGEDALDFNGCFGVVRMDGAQSGMQNMCANLISVGDVLKMQTGDLFGPMRQAFCRCAPGQPDGKKGSAKSDGAVITTIPVITLLNDREVRVIGFASFYLESVDENESTISVVRLKNIVSSKPSAKNTAEDFGVYAVNLDA